MPTDNIEIMNGFVTEAVFNSNNNNTTTTISVLKDPMKPSNSNFSKLFPIFNCKTYSVESPRKFHIPHQYTRMMITILAKYLNSTLTNQDVSDEISRGIYEFIKIFEPIQLLNKFNITQGKSYQTDSESKLNFVVDETDLLFADFITEFVKESTVIENNLKPEKYVDFESKREYCERIITTFLEQCYVMIMYSYNT